MDATTGTDRYALALEILGACDGVGLLWVGSVLYRHLVVEKHLRKVRAAFSRFVSRDVVDPILDSTGLSSFPSEND